MNTEMPESKMCGNGDYLMNLRFDVVGVIWSIHSGAGHLE
jgi:hypothetical protein